MRPAEHEPTLLEIWVVTDGYWCDLTKNACPGELTPEYDELTDGLLEVFGRAIDHLRPGAGLPELDRLVRAGIAAATPTTSGQWEADEPRETHLDRCQLSSAASA